VPGLSREDRIPTGRVQSRNPRNDCQDANRVERNQVLSQSFCAISVLNISEVS